jgi:hypothetical protein
MRTVLPSGRRKSSHRQSTNRDNQFVCYSGRKTQASASAPRFRRGCENCRTATARDASRGYCASETKSAPERTMPAAAQPIEIPFTLYDGVRDCCGWPERRPGAPKVAPGHACKPERSALALISNDTCLVGVVDRSVPSWRTPIPPEKELRGTELRPRAPQQQFVNTVGSTVTLMKCSSCEARECRGHAEHSTSNNTFHRFFS